MRPAGIRALDPGIGVRALQLLAPHRDAQRAALRHRALRLRGGDAARPLVGGRRGDAEQRRGPQELAPVDLTVGELALQLGDVGVLAVLAHDGLPGWWPAGSLPARRLVAASSSAPRLAPCQGNAPQRYGLFGTMQRREIEEAGLPVAFADWFARRGWSPHAHQLAM